ELLLRVALDVHAAERLAAPRGVRIGRARVVLGLPVVAHLLERVLERGEGGPVGALTLAVRLHRAVVRLGPGPLGLGRRAPDRRRHLLPGGHPRPPRLGTAPLTAPFSAPVPPPPTAPNRSRRGFRHRARGYGVLRGRARARAGARITDGVEVPCRCSSSG